MNAPAITGTPQRRSPGEFWRRTWAMLVKEFIQLKRDRVSFAMIIMIPLVQRLLFGYAINTNPRHLPTAVLLQEQSDLGRSVLKALQNTAYFDVVQVVQSEAEFDRLLASGAVLFAIGAVGLLGQPGERHLVAGHGCPGVLDVFGEGRLVPYDAGVLVGIGIVEALDASGLAAKQSVQLRSNEVLRALADLVTSAAFLEDLGAVLD